MKYGVLLLVFCLGLGTGVYFSGRKSETALNPSLTSRGYDAAVPHTLQLKETDKPRPRLPLSKDATQSISATSEFTDNGAPSMSLAQVQTLMRKIPITKVRKACEETEKQWYEMLLSQYDKKDPELEERVFGELNSKIENTAFWKTEVRTGDQNLTIIFMLYDSNKISFGGEQKEAKPPSVCWAVQVYKAPYDAEGISACAKENIRYIDRVPYVTIGRLENFSPLEALAIPLPDFDGTIQYITNSVEKWQTSESPKWTAVSASEAKQIQQSFTRQDPTRSTAANE